MPALPCPLVEWAHITLAQSTAQLGAVINEKQLSTAIPHGARPPNDFKELLWKRKIIYWDNAIRKLRMYNKKLS